MAFGDSKLKAQQKAAAEEANKMASHAEDDNSEESAPKEKLSFRQKWDMRGPAKEFQQSSENRNDEQSVSSESMKVDTPPPSTPNVSAGRGRAEAFRERQKEEEKKSFNQRNQNSYSRSSASVANEVRKEEGLKDFSGSLDPKLVVIIEKVCTFLNKSKKEVDEIMEKAVKNPEAVKSEYNTMYNDIVQPKTQERYRSIEDAQAKNPDRIVFMSVKDGEDKLIGLMKDKYPSFEIYQGTIMQTVEFDRTPFEAPSKLFANEAKKENVVENKEEVTAQQTPSRPKP